MSDSDLEVLGSHIAQLRLSRQLKQTELAYEAGVSHRTLQRLEAGEAVRSDGLLRIIRCLGRLDEVLGALDTAAFSPYELLSGSGLSLAELKEGAASAAQGKPRKRVRRAGRTPVGEKQAKVQWPEDRS